MVCEASERDRAGGAIPRNAGSDAVVEAMREMVSDSPGAMSRDGAQHLNDPPKPGGLEGRTASAGDTLTLTLRGELDMAAGPVLERELQLLRSSGFSHWVIDLSELDFMDSTGLHFLARARGVSEAMQCNLAITPGHGQVRRLLELTHLAASFPLEG